MSPTQPLLHLTSPQLASKWCNQQREGGETIGFVPTMGALHRGHLSLVERAADENDLVCASIFVNPLQFNNEGDFERYPQDLDMDFAHLERAGCAMVFTGTMNDFFPEATNPERIRTLDPGICAQGLEGDFRPGHFAGVCTIVERLFKTVGEGRSYFGEKDYQQSRLVLELAQRLGSPEVVICPTIREPSGLAMSSRNRLLSKTGRNKAAIIHQSLQHARQCWRDGEHDAKKIRNEMRSVLERAELEIEYADLREESNWSADSPQGIMDRPRALIAVRIEGVRLIDNLYLPPSPEERS
ncbi:MAG: pantoate--beta-alanine ligase [Arenicellales bacterium]|nr:pantoate--beta-alanine ligase [Arenicellales bacterium]